MAATRAGSIRIFRAFDIDVYLHWSWLLVAFFQVHYRSELDNRYDQLGWYWIEYVSLFAIVLMHEFGHALACRQVGGMIDHIVLWPLGGIAFVNPPPRPGAVLWSIAAGPLVNVVLVPVTGGLWAVSTLFDWGATYPDLAHFVEFLFGMNTLLLIFNLLPIYPLDGGQIVQALLWFGIGRANSLMVVSILGMVVGGCALIPAVVMGQVWLSIIAVFVAFRAVIGFQQARLLRRIVGGPRNGEAICPSCGESPLLGKHWVCNECGTRFDTFKNHGQCPGCGKLFYVTRCPECYKEHPIEHWFAAPVPKDQQPRSVPW